MTTHDINERFGEIRSLANGKPLKSSWQKLVKLIDQWEDEATMREMVVPYLRDQLASWHKVDREGPPSWGAEQLFGPGAPHPAAALCNVLDLTEHYESYIKDEHVALILVTFPLLKKLNLNGNQIRLKGAQLLARSEMMRSLEVLDVGMSAIPARGVCALLNSDAPKLRSLTIGDSSAVTSWRDLKELGDGAGMPALEELIVDSDMRPDALAALLRWPAMSRVRALTLLPAEPGSLARALDHAAPLDALRSVTLGYSMINDVDLGALLLSPAAARLQRLDLAGCEQLDALSCQLLAAHRGLKSLRSLDLGETNLSRLDLEPLLTSPLLAQLHELRLDGLLLADDLEELLGRADLHIKLRKSLEEQLDDARYDEDDDDYYDDEDWE